MRRFGMCCICNCKVWTHYWQQGRMGKNLFAQVQRSYAFIFTSPQSCLPCLSFPLHQEQSFPNSSCLLESCPSRKDPGVLTSSTWMVQVFTSAAAFLQWVSDIQVPALPGYIEILTLYYHFYSYIVLRCMTLTLGAFRSNGARLRLR